MNLLQEVAFILRKYYDARGSELEKYSNEVIDLVQKSTTIPANTANTLGSKEVYSIDDLLMVWRHDIIPLIEEYCYGHYHLMNKLIVGKESSDWFTETKGFEGLSNAMDLKRLLEDINASISHQ